MSIPLCVKLLGWAAESLEHPAEKSNVEFIDSWCQHNRGNECSLSTRIGVCVLCSHHHACIAHRYTAYNFRYLALIPSVVLELPNFKKILRTDKKKLFSVQSWPNLVRLQYLWVCKWGKNWLNPILCYACTVRLSFSMVRDGCNCAGWRTV